MGKKKQSAGISLAVVMVFIAMFLVLGISMMMASQVSVQQAVLAQRVNLMFYGAEGTVQLAAQGLREQMEVGNLLSNRINTALNSSGTALAALPTSSWPSTTNLENWLVNSLADGIATAITEVFESEDVIGTPDNRPDFWYLDEDDPEAGVVVTTELYWDSADPHNLLSSDPRTNVGRIGFRGLQDAIDSLPPSGNTHTFPSLEPYFELTSRSGGIYSTIEVVLDLGELTMNMGAWGIFESGDWNTANFVDGEGRRWEYHDPVPSPIPTDIVVADQLYENSSTGRFEDWTNALRLMQQETFPAGQAGPFRPQKFVTAFNLPANHPTLVGHSFTFSEGHIREALNDENFAAPTGGLDGAGRFVITLGAFSAASDLHFELARLANYHRYEVRQLFIRSIGHLNLEGGNNAQNIVIGVSMFPNLRGIYFDTASININDPNPGEASSSLEITGFNHNPGCMAHDDPRLSHSNAPDRQPLIVYINNAFTAGVNTINFNNVEVYSGNTMTFNLSHTLGEPGAINSGAAVTRFGNATFYAGNTGDGGGRGIVFRNQGAPPSNVTTLQIGTQSSMPQFYALGGGIQLEGSTGNRPLKLFGIFATTSNLHVFAANDVPYIEVTGILIGPHSSQARVNNPGQGGGGLDARENDHFTDLEPDNDCAFLHSRFLQYGGYLYRERNDPDRPGGSGGVSLNTADSSATFSHLQNLRETTHG